jgi:hypothetical protein
MVGDSKKRAERSEVVQLAKSKATGMDVDRVYVTIFATCPTHLAASEAQSSYAICVPDLPHPRCL